jgi:hypothetical protein
MDGSRAVRLRASQSPLVRHGHVCLWRSYPGGECSHSLVHAHAHLTPTNVRCSQRGFRTTHCRMMLRSSSRSTMGTCQRSPESRCSRRKRGTLRRSVGRETLCSDPQARWLISFYASNIGDTTSSLDLTRLCPLMRRHARSFSISRLPLRKFGTRFAAFTGGAFYYLIRSRGIPGRGLIKLQHSL